jgi:hypothetical protein
MHLCKVSVSKSATATRKGMQTALDALGALGAAWQLSVELPPVRSASDAVRAAASYALHDWRKFTHGEYVCRALAESPVGAEKRRGLHLQINVVMRHHTHVDYSRPVCTLRAQKASDTPVLEKQDAAKEFDVLVRALDPSTLVEHGQTTLYDGDIRRLIEACLAPCTIPFWHGVLLVVDQDAADFARRVAEQMGAVVDHGDVRVSLIALEMHDANRQALAEELAEDLSMQFQKVIERCSYDAPNRPDIHRTYDAIVARMAQAEMLLDVGIPCLDALTACEDAIALMDEAALCASD